MISGETIARAERSLLTAIQIKAHENILYQRARVERGAFDQFLAEQMELLKRHRPDLDPRVESPLQTIMRHMFLVGCLAGREEGQL